MMLLHDLYDEEMRRQQELLLLWLLLKDFGDHMTHSISKGSLVDGT